MRDYAKVSARFWTGETGKKIKAHGPEATIVALYLMTSPHSNMLGLYFLPKMYIAHETGLPFEGASKGLQRCIEGDFCTYEEASEMVFVHEMARFQIADQLKPGDKQVKGIARELEKLPQTALFKGFYEKYATSFHLPEVKGLRRALKGPPKPRAGTRAGTRAGKGADELPPGFAEFWSIWPNKVAKDKAIESWVKVSPDDALQLQILDAVRWQSKSTNWTKDDGQFIPHPTTWLNQRRWTDERPKSNGACVQEAKVLEPGEWR